MMAKNTQNKSAAKKQADQTAVNEEAKADNTKPLNDAVLVTDAANNDRQAGDDATSVEPTDGPATGGDPENPDPESDEGAGGSDNDPGQTEQSNDHKPGEIKDSDGVVLTGRIAVVELFFQGFKDGETVRKDFPKGDYITGALAENAVMCGWAKWLSDEELQARVEAAKAADDENE